MEAIALGILKSGGVTWLALIGLAYAYWRQQGETKALWEARLKDKDDAIKEMSAWRSSIDQHTRAMELLTAEVRGRGK